MLLSIEQHPKIYLYLYRDIKTEKRAHKLFHAIYNIFFGLCVYVCKCLFMLWERAKAANWSSQKTEKSKQHPQNMDNTTIFVVVVVVGWHCYCWIICVLYLERNEKMPHTPWKWTNRLYHSCFCKLCTGSNRILPGSALPCSTLYSVLFSGPGAIYIYIHKWYIFKYLDIR